MVLGFRGWKNRLAQMASVKLAGNIDKKDFLSQLKEQWRPFVKRSSNIEDEVTKARERIEKSDFRGAFDKLGITDEDLRGVFKELQEENPEQVIRGAKEVGRNNLCPCGSGKKYKRCCGK